MRTIIFLLICLFSFSAFATNDYEKALTDFENNDIDSAYIHLKNTLKTTPNNLPAKILMGKILIQKKLFQEGIEELQEALSFGADINLLLSDLGNALMVTQAFEQTIQLGKSQTLTTENKLTWLLLSGNAYSSLKEYSKAKQAFQNALVIAPTNIRSLNAFAAFELNQGRFDSAKKMIDKSMALSPKDSRIWHLQGQYYNSKKDDVNALISFERAYLINANDPFVQRALVHAYTNDKQYDKALVIAEKVLLKTPNDPFAALLKSQLLISVDRDEEANALLISLSEKLSRLTDEQKSTDASLAYIAGTAAYLQNNLEVAQQNLQFYVNEKPEDLQALYLLVDIFIRQKQSDKAFNLLESKEKLFIDDLQLSLILVDLYLVKNKLYSAELMLTNLEIKYKNNSDFIISKTNWYAKNKQYSKAMTLLEQNEPKEFNPRYLLTKGFLYKKIGKFTEANQCADLLLTKFPNNIDYIAFKGSLFLQQKQWQKAIVLFDQILESDADNLSAEFNKATALGALGHFDEAEKSTSILIQLYPDNLSLKILIAKLARDKGNITEAVAMLKKLINANSTNIYAIETLLNIQLNQKNYQEALVLSDQLSKLVFLKPQYIEQKAEIYLALHDNKKALKELGKLRGLIESPIELYRVSLLQMKAEDTTAAIKTLNYALKVSPNNLIIKLELIQIDIDLGNLIATNKQLKALEVEMKNNANILLTRGNWLMKKDQLTKAQSKYLKALKLDHNFNSALTKLYQLTLNNIGNKSFSTTVQAILNENPDKHFMRSLYADFLLNTGDLNQAKEHYIILSKVDDLPNKSSILNNLANIYIESDLLNAEKHVLQALQLNSTSSAINDTYGWILTLREKHEEGLIVLRHAFSMNSTDPSINYHLGYTLFKLGRIDEANDELLKALSSSRDFSERADAAALAKAIKQQIES
ncbi:MAG: PEP-CTERM system TPR-repeat protein PrsT [Colwellia sp.]|nr:PEP-CTERM system TPR-repeat protein PrsT [Colwellia sp.]